jgi:hypothetical protein
MLIGKIDSKLMPTMLLHQSELFCSCGYILATEQQLTSHLGK